MGGQTQPESFRPVTGPPRDKPIRHHGHSGRRDLELTVTVPILLLREQQHTPSPNVLLSMATCGSPKCFIKHGKRWQSAICLTNNLLLTYFNHSNLVPDSASGTKAIAVARTQSSQYVAPTFLNACLRLYKTILHRHKKPSLQLSM